MMHRRTVRRWSNVVAMVLLSTCILSAHAIQDDILEPHAAYKWDSLEYEWPSTEVRDQFIKNGSYIPENNGISGIKVFGDKVYVTVPRLKLGVPATLNVIVETANSSSSLSASHVLRPFPSWEMQTLGDCDALQFVQAFEFDPNTGYLWIVDTGCMPRKGEVNPTNSCPAKVVIFDLINSSVVSVYEFPRETVGYGTFLLTDIVLHYDNGTARWAYISDSLDYKLIVYDHLEGRSYYYSYPNMRPSRQYDNITISNETINDVVEGISGLALSPDFRFLYYSSVAGIFLHQIPTEILTSAEGSTGAFAASVRHIGSKVNQGKAMACGVKNKLYYSALSENSVYKWDIQKDAETDGIDSVVVESQRKFIFDRRILWVDSLTLDERGNLWMTSTNTFTDDVNEKSYGVEGRGPNFYVWKVAVDDYHYLHHSWKDAITTVSKASQPVWLSQNFSFPILALYISSLVFFHYSL